VFSGLTGQPRLGTEIRTAGLGSSPGGVANLAVALARLDLRVGLAAAFSTDLYGGYLWRTLGEQEGVDLSASRRVVGWATPVTVSLAYERERSMITYEEPPPLPVGQLLSSSRRARSFFTHVDDGQMPWLGRVREAGTTVFADVGWDTSERWSAGVLDNLAAVDVFLPNAVEAMAYTRTQDPEAALEVLARLVPTAIVKCGRDGALACSLATGERVHEPAIPIEALDPTGAGDVFGAAIVAGTLEGWPLAERLRFANLCAGLSCRFFGGSLAAPCWNEVASWCRELEADPDVPAHTKRGYRFLQPYYDRHVRSVKCRRPRPTIIAG
jgi:sugar/nucleoside kinase (ribokinase family)